MSDPFLVGIGIAYYPSKPGAVDGYFVEHTVSKEWAINLSKEVTKLDMIPVLAPVGYMHKKIDFLNNRGVNCCLEIQFNDSLKRMGKQGCETLYYNKSPTGARLASFIQRELTAATGLKDRGIKPGFYKVEEQGLNVPLAFLRHTESPAVLIKPEFIFNMDKFGKDVMFKATHAIAKATLEFLGDSNG